MCGRVFGGGVRFAGRQNQKMFTDVHQVELKKFLAKIRRELLRASCYVNSRACTP